MTDHEPRHVVHLIYSDGRCRDEDIWEAYSIALFPFMLGIPTEQVFLTANSRILRCERQRNDVESSVAVETDGIPPYFPNGYHDYFAEICQNQTSGFDAIGAIPPPTGATPQPVTIRIISGRGFFAGCQMTMRSAHGNTLFSEIPEAASILTIFDICGSPFALAAMEGFWSEDPHARLSSRPQYVNESTSRFACDGNDSTYAFRVGRQGDAESPPETQEQMSKCFGDAVVCNVLRALREYQNNEFDGDINEVFKSKYCELNLSYMGNLKLRPNANLDALAAALKAGELHLDDAKFDCSLFNLANEWFLTDARATNTTGSGAQGIQQDMVETLIEFVVAFVKGFHMMNPHQFEPLRDSEIAWRALVGLVGPKLESVNLQWTEETKSLHRSRDGTPLRGWAEATPDLDYAAAKVQNLLASGQWEEEDDDGDN